MLSGLPRNFRDRTCPIWPKLEGKKSAGLFEAQEGIGQAIGNLSTYALVCNMQWMGSVTALAKTPGEAARDKNLERRLKQRAEKLVLSME